ncbi:unnamed protein product, partial [Caenorhabditis auriculariae]
LKLFREVTYTLATTQRFCWRNLHRPYVSRKPWAPDAVCILLKNQDRVYPTWRTDSRGQLDCRSQLLEVRFLPRALAVPNSLRCRNPWAPDAVCILQKNQDRVYHNVADRQPWPTRLSQPGSSEVPFPYRAP